MAIQNLSSEVRGFLYNLFNTSAEMFKGATQVVSPGASEGVISPSASLAAAFQRVAFVARRGTLQDVNDALKDLVQKVKATTDQGVKDQIETARLQEQLFYRMQVRNNKQLQADLGAFSSGIL